MRILIADDMEYARVNIMEMVKKIFQEAEIDTFSDGTHAWKAVKKREYDLLFTDVRMIRMHGPELAEKVAEKYPYTEIFFVTGEDKAELEQLGIDPKEYAKSYLEGFDYKIGDVTVDEDKGTATAEVTITCKSMNQIVEDFATQYQEKVAALDSMPSDDELYKMAGQVMVDVTKAAKTKDTKVTFKYSCNDDGEWSADDSATNEMMNAMMS